MKKPKTRKDDESELYDPLFHPSRFEIVEQQLSPDYQKKFKDLSNEDKALFINILIKEGKLSW